MKQVFTIVFGVVILCYFSACQQKMACPAYHSYFILDVDETRKTFSLFGADSLPRKNWDIDKEKYGIARDISDHKKLRDMRIISMNSIYKKIEDPFASFQRVYAEADSMVYIDSASILADSKGLNDFKNIDQMIYLHHFGKYLPAKNTAGGRSVKDTFKEDMKQEEAPLVEDGDEDEPKKKFRLFNRKKKNTDGEGENDDEE
jgi:hypothetical protein